MWGKVERYFFSEAAAFNLGLSRLLFFAFWTVWLWNSHSSALADVDLRMIWRPISFFEWIPLVTLTPILASVLLVIFRTAMVFACIGLWTRWSVCIATLLALLFCGLPCNFGKVDHSSTLPLVTAMVLSISRCGDAISVDALWRQRFWGGFSGEYRWPLRAIRIYILWIYFSAGFQKLYFSGASWISSDFLQKVIRTGDRPVGIWLSHNAWLVHLIALATVIVELGAPFALLHPFLALILVPSTAFFLLGADYFLNLGGFFLPFLFAYVFWIPWQEIWRGQIAPVLNTILGRVETYFTLPATVSKFFYTLKDR